MPLGDILELSIHDLSRSGPGLGREPSGRVVFVPYTAPGDQVRVEIVEEKKRYAEGRVLEILTPSPMRVNPPCPVFTKCGGCEWQHVPYELQWETKLAGVKGSLERVGILPPEKCVELPAEKIWNYRNRVQLRGEKSEIGFLAPGSLNIVPINECTIARPEINAMIPSLREKGAALLKRYKVEVTADEAGQVRTNWNSKHSSGGFQQVHTEQNQVLRAWVKERIPHGAALLDLYGGGGNLSLALAEKLREVHCVDAFVPREVPDQPKNFFFHRGHVDQWLMDFNWAAAAEGAAKVTVLDPPREGLAEPWLGIVENLKRLEVELVLAIGCDSASWARDVHRLTRHGFELVEIGALDLFPQTHHVEALAVLRRIGE